MTAPRPARPRRYESPAGLVVHVNANGSIRRMEHGDIVLNLFPGTEMEGGPANLYLRRLGSTSPSNEDALMLRRAQHERGKGHPTGNSAHPELVEGRAEFLFQPAGSPGTTRAVGSLEAVALELVIQRTQPDPETFRRDAAVATDEGERMFDRFALQVGKRLHPGR